MNWRKGLAFLIVLAGVAVGAIYVEPWKVLVNVILVFGIWSLYSEPKEEKVLSVGWTRFWLVVCIALLVFSRLYPFTNSEAPLGYDTGIYGAQIERSVEAMPEYISSIYLGLPLITNYLSLLGFETKEMLGWIYAFWSVVVGLLVYVLAKHTWGTRRGLGVLFLFAVSFTQWQAFSFMLYKNIIALSLLLLSFLFLQRRSFLLLPVVFFLALLQPSDFLIWALAMVVYFFIGIWDPKERKYLCILAGLGVLGGGGLLAYDTTVWTNGIELLKTFWNDPDSLNPVIRTGLFIPFDEYIVSTLLYWSFAVLAVVKMWGNKRARILIAYFAVISAWVLSRFLFYERFVIELDLIVVVLAGAMIVPLIDTLWREKMGKLTLVSLALGLTVNMIVGVLYSPPWISQEELHRIQGYCDTVPEDAYLMVADSVYGPWAYHYSCHDTIVPGLFEFNKWNYTEWQQFWNGGDVETIRGLMARYGDREIYLYVGEKQVQMHFSEELFEKVEERLWRYRLNSDSSDF